MSVMRNKKNIHESLPGESKKDVPGHIYENGPRSRTGVFLRLAALSLAGLLIGGAAALCGDSSNLGYVHVDMIDNSFSPQLQRIHKGGTIVFSGSS